MIYIHIPFCRSFCSYCAFYSEIPPRASRSSVLRRYIDAVCVEARKRREEIIAAEEPRTLYLGGGTPSLLSAYEIGEIVTALPFDKYEEFTLEANPEDIYEKGAAYLQELTSLGVNRISMGVQSFHDGVLRRMGRRHNAERALEAVEIVRKAGMQNLSIDLIFGMNGISDSIWEDTLAQAIALRPEHISAYQLSLDEGSALARLVAKGKYEEMTEEQCARQYEMLCTALAEAGYVHYEISNFALSGHEAVHNSAYWSRKAYVGLGPGAHSFDGKRTRSWNSELRNAAEQLHYTREHETLSDEDIRVETIMLGLRTAAGLPEGILRSLVAPDAFARLVSNGQLVLEGKNLRIPESRFFVADEIIRELI